MPSLPAPAFVCLAGKKMEMDVQGVSQPFPHTQGSGGCQQQDGQAGDPGGDSSQQQQQQQEKEDKKRFTLKSSGVLDYDMLAGCRYTMKPWFVQLNYGLMCLNLNILQKVVYLVLTT